MAFQTMPGLAAQEPLEPKLNIVVIEGEGAINNVRQRTAREPIVQVEDQNRKPVAGATVTFLLPRDGAGVAMRDGSRSFTAVTDQNGRATMRGLRPNNVAGQFQIQVNASFQGLTSSAVITQTNMAVAAAAAGAGAGAGIGLSAKLIAVLAIAGGAAATGAVVAATRGGDSPKSTAAPPIVVTPGTPSVGSPR
ncbi:MAG TPA: hypothetical protein VN428_22565 [Bryobacteraceae bacterium]|nr:hypothetical protein [Bryobacteraceae bacterium]